MFLYFLVLVTLVCQLESAPISNKEFDNAVIFLRKYGYITEDYPSVHEVREALSLYQARSLLDVTGEMDDHTLAKMKHKRCPHKDIVEEEPEEEDYYHRRRKRFALMHYTRIQNEKFKDGRVHLTWHISRPSKHLDLKAVREVIRKAFHVWSSQANIDRLPHVRLEFEEVSNRRDADIDIRWEGRDHGDADFDGAGFMEQNILAHAFQPNKSASLGRFIGVIHIDERDEFSLDTAGPGHYLPYIITHEIGHILGLNHTYNADSVMHSEYKMVPPDRIKLSRDDKCGLNWTYIGPSNECLYMFLVGEVMQIGAKLESERAWKEKLYNKKGKADSIPRPPRSSRRRISSSRRSHHRN